MVTSFAPSADPGANVFVGNVPSIDLGVDLDEYIQVHAADGSPPLAHFEDVSGTSSPPDQVTNTRAKQKKRRRNKERRENNDMQAPADMHSSSKQSNSCRARRR